jgi:hypothetical protein
LVSCWFAWVNTYRSPTAHGVCLNTAAYRLDFQQTHYRLGIAMPLQIQMPAPSGDELKAARTRAGLSQVEAATLMGYPVQSGSRGGLQSRTWQALESANDPRNMPGSIFAMFLLLTNKHPQYALVRRNSTFESDSALSKP